MIPRNAIRRKRNFRRFSSSYRFLESIKNKFIPLEKEGVMTKSGVKKYQDWFMQEEHNYLFGNAYNLEVGLTTNSIFSNRNCNQLIVGAPGMGKSYNFMLSNLRQKNHSAVVMDYSFTLKKEQAELNKNGIKTHRMDFYHPEISSRYNPFLHVTTESQITLLSELICDFIGLGKRTGNLFHEKLEVRLIDLAVNYIVKSDTLEKKDKTFFVLSKIIQKICKEGPGVTRGYDIDDKYRDFLVYPSEKFAEKTEPLANAVSILTLPEFNCFTELSETDNISAEELGTELTYVFVSGCQYSSSKEEIGLYHHPEFIDFFLSMLILDLYRFGEDCIQGKTKYKSLNSQHFLPFHVHFYLDDFQYRKIPNFLKILLTDRVYGLGFSLMIRYILQLKEKYPKEEWLTVPAACDTLIFLGNFEPEDYDYFSRLERKLTSKQIRDIIEQGKILVLVRACTPFVCERIDPNEI